MHAVESESHPRGGRHAQLDSATASSRCRASPYRNIYQKTASQASLHAVESESRPRGGRHAQLEAAARPLAVGLRPMGIFAKIVLREQACTQLNQRVIHAGAAMRSSIPLPLHLAVGLRPIGIFTKKLLRKQACTQLNQRVVHAGAAMRSSKPLRGLSLSGFALWEYLPKNCFASKLARSFSANIPA